MSAAGIYAALTARAQSARAAAAGAGREGRYREATSLRDQADADLARATRLRRTRCAWWQAADCVAEPLTWANGAEMMAPSRLHARAFRAFMAPCPGLTEPVGGGGPFRVTRLRWCATAGAYGETR